MRFHVAPIRCGGSPRDAAFDMEAVLAACAFTATLLLAGCSGMPATGAGELIDQALAGPHRAKGNGERDVYRHPRDTLLFFGLRPDMTVVEIWPGGGWYTEVLAPVVRGRGLLYAAHFYVDKKSPPYMGTTRDNFRNKLAASPAIYDQVQITAFNAPDQLNIAPAGTVDMVLTFRNVHNWAAAKSDAAAFRAFYAALKPGGILGVVEHRAKDGASLEEMIKSGYMTEAYVISLAEKAGFKLAAKSEVNANPKDSKDHPRGVWTLPPTYRLGNQDRAKYAAIGESDRMTLRFVKPAY
jgi:predicted methyltransferase